VPFDAAEFPPGAAPHAANDRAAKLATAMIPKVLNFILFLLLYRKTSKYSENSV
jgi:hypothetical protein